MRVALGIPLRLKIVLLLSTALTVSLLSYLWVGTRLVVQDKVSYLYDFNLAQVRTAAESIEASVDRIETGSQIIAQWLLSGSPKARVLSQSVFDSTLKPLGVSGVLFLRPEGNVFSAVERFGVTEVKGQSLESLVSQLGWNAQWIKSKRTLVGAGADGGVPVGGWVVGADGNELAYIALLSIDPKLLEDASRKMALHLIDPVGRSVLMAFPALEGQDPQHIRDFERELLAGQFPQGVKDWGGYIVGYQRLRFPELMVVSYVPEASAYSAVNRLAQRSFVLGVSILLLAVGLTLIFVKGITRKLVQMWAATRKVASGDFSVRVQTSGQKSEGRDEVEGLAHSFNTMASKIDELMIATAQKARMEKELETAQTVQSRFFPTGGFTHPNLQLAGTYVPASECAGDWWHYIQIGDYLLTVVGDVTGHGVSAALVTASVHGAFSILMQQLQRSSGGRSVPPSLSAIFRYLNTAVRASASGGASMTFIGSLIDLRTGQMVIANASHFPPYLLSASADRANPMQAMKPLLIPTQPALGRQDDLEVETGTFQLKPGDSLFWYTDGFFEGPEAVGKKVSNRKMLKILMESAADHPTELAKACEKALSGLFDLMGHAAERPDDITLVFAKIPDTAKFEAVDSTVTAAQAA